MSFFTEKLSKTFPFIPNLIEILLMDVKSRLLLKIRSENPNYLWKKQQQQSRKLYFKDVPKICIFCFFSLFIWKFQWNHSQKVFKKVLNPFELHFRLQHRRKTKKNEEDQWRCFDQPANFSWKLFALKSKETAKKQINLHTYAYLLSKKRQSDSQAFHLRFKGH